MPPSPSSSTTLKASVRPRRRWGCMAGAESEVQMCTHKSAVSIGKPQPQTKAWPLMRWQIPEWSQLGWVLVIRRAAKMCAWVSQSRKNTNLRGLEGKSKANQRQAKLGICVSWLLVGLGVMGLVCSHLLGVLSRTVCITYMCMYASIYTRVHACVWIYNVYRTACAEKHTLLW